MFDLVEKGYTNFE